MYAWIYFWALGSVPLVDLFYVSTMLFDYCSDMYGFESSNDAPCLALLSHDCSGPSRYTMAAS